MENALKLVNTQKKYGKNTILENVSFSVRKGEVFGFLGRNGAGKSTLIHLLTGIIHKTNGQIQVLEHPIYELDQVKKRIGVFPDIDQFYRHLTGFQHLRYFAKISGVHKTRKQIETILIECGLATSIHKKVKSYSFGMKKKLGFAQAIVNDPELMILDEPTSGLDPESAIVMRKQIKTLNKNGTTVFMTSHNLNELEQISDRIGILKQGTMASIGSINELRNQYSSSFIVQIDGDFPSNMNEIKQLNCISFDKKRLKVEVQNEAAISSLLKTLLYHGALIYKVEHELLSLEDIFLMEE